MSAKMDRSQFIAFFAKLLKLGIDKLRAASKGR